ncbi:MAG TPA: cyclic nucleotide-binding domain-containing protein [Afifellaceae bacterium]|nr:cyclic nucleotide-binding domain-containing protein [Afifellaceae bacterium]
MSERRRELVRRLAEAVRGPEDRDEGLYLPGWELSDWEVLLSDADIIQFQDGDIVLRKGDSGSNLYFLVLGKLEVSVPQAGSISISPVISIEPGSVVGEIAFLDEHGRSASVWSRGRSELLRLRRETFNELKLTNPALICDLLQAIGRIVAQRMRKRISAAGQGTYGD